MQGVPLRWSYEIPIDYFPTQPIFASFGDITPLDSTLKHAQIPSVSQDSNKDEDLRHKRKNIRSKLTH